MYHTQEKWEEKLDAPIPTSNEDAWLGDGCYFWYYESDAIWWGRTFKWRTGYYEVYKADMNCDNILDTVFNEEHYVLWLKYVEKAIQKFLRNERGSITLKYINDFFKEKGVFDNIDGVMFQDISDNPDNWIVKKFQYKKRIQLAVYNLEIISNFAFHFESECPKYKRR
jgi:hypothetical protein